MCVCASVEISIEVRKLAKDKWGGDFEGRGIELMWYEEDGE